MINRADIVKWIMQEFEIEWALAVKIMRAMDDDKIAEIYGLKVIRKGGFTR